MNTKDEIIKKLAFELFRTREALESANKLLAEEHLFGILVDTTSATFHKAKREKKQIQLIVEDAKNV